MSLFFRLAGLVLRLYYSAAYAMTLRYYRSRGVRIGRNVRLYGRLDRVNPHLISIGDNVVLGLGSRVLTHGPVKVPGPVRIGNDVWIGAAVLILPGVAIGEGAICGAGAVVTKDVSPRAIVAGNPARVIGQRTEEDLLKTREAMLQGRSIGLVPRQDN
jgi:maltose O-acetyltransferase